MTARPRIFSGVLLSIVAMGGLVACSSDDDSAADQVCDERADLQEDLDEVAADLRAGNLGEARDSLDDVRSSAQELVDAVADLGAEERRQLGTDLDELQTDLDSLGTSDGLSGLEQAFESVRDGVQGSLQSLQGDLRC